MTSVVQDEVFGFLAWFDMIRLYVNRSSIGSSPKIYIFRHETGHHVESYGFVGFAGSSGSLRPDCGEGFILHPWDLNK